MKTRHTKPGILKAIASYRGTIAFIMATALITSSHENLFSRDTTGTNIRNNTTGNNNIITEVEWVNLKGEYENQNIPLQWEISNNTDIAYFCVEYSRNDDFMFEEVAVLNPTECIDTNKNKCYNFKTRDKGDADISYFRVRVVYQDNHSISSNVISIKKSSSIPNLAISEIINQGGMISLNFKSSKTQEVTLSILNISGEQLAAKMIFANEGDNTYTFNPGFTSTEMLIFSLNNTDEIISKKYTMTAAW